MLWKANYNVQWGGYQPDHTKATVRPVCMYKGHSHVV